MICRNCNNNNIDGVKFCFYCGCELISDNSVKQENVTESVHTKDDTETTTYISENINKQLINKDIGQNGTIGVIHNDTVSANENANNKKTFSFNLNKKIVIIGGCVTVAFLLVIGVVIFSITSVSNRNSQNLYTAENYSEAYNNDNYDEETTESMSDDIDYGRLVDRADLLTDSEESKLLLKLDEISEKNKMDIVVVTVDALEGKTSTEYADDFYDYNGYGYGSDNDGVLFLVSAEEREWALSTCGAGITVFSDKVLKQMEDKFCPQLSENDYYGAFNTYADLCDDFISGKAKDNFAKETGFKQVKGSEQVIYADSKKNKLTLIDWSQEIPEIQFETKTVYFGMDGITDSPSEYKSATPKGTFRLGFAFSDEYLDTSLDTLDVTSGMVWVDDPYSDYYNTVQYGSTNNPPMWSSAENTYAIFANDYNYACILIEHNGDGYTKGKSGKGSAIYLSGKEKDVSKSYGDVNITAKDMRKLLSYLDESKNPYIVIK